MIKDIGSKNNKDISESSEKAGFIIFDEICNDSSSAASANDFMSDSIWKKSPGSRFVDPYHFLPNIVSLTGAPSTASNQ